MSLARVPRWAGTVAIVIAIVPLLGAVVFGQMILEYNSVIAMDEAHPWAESRPEFWRERRLVRIEQCLACLVVAGAAITFGVKVRRSRR